MRLRHSSAFPGLALCATLLLAACGDGDSANPTGKPPTGLPKPGEAIPGDDAEDFLSHVPGRSGGHGAGGAGAESADGGTAAPGASDDGAQRAILEADILQRDGDTLYALSRFAGLNVIDISDPAHLKLLGNYRKNAEPFEMYLRAGVAYIMYNDRGRYALDETSGSWLYRTSSSVLALDISNPSQITRIAEHEVAGSISDSRLVGDVMYLVTHENGYCWDCDRQPNTRVASFDVKRADQFEKIDELRFEDQQGWAQRSISVTTDRIYVAGPNWQDRDSDIQVVDIHDPAGDLVMGATVPLHGSVQSRWQMDEYNGVLRVISQPTLWRANDVPYVQTFEVESSSKITSLASLPMKLPRLETLQSVRFDGTRAYAVTFLRTDPLFTFDLTDPARPRQLGELEIPGFLYHMEPRGNRLYALGYDTAGQAGALHVSIFDVSNLSAPTMLDRVNFGGDWGSFAEDQDRIQKAFNILLDQGLILVPFSGGSYDSAGCDYAYQSGIQLIDVAGDDLTLRAVAPQVGSARRAFIHRERLFGITDNAVSVFDISDRSRPVAITQLEVARNISQVHLMGDTLLRFGTDWWTSRSILDFTSLTASETAEPLGELDLNSLVAAGEDQCNSWSSWDQGVYVHGDTAYVARRGSSKHFNNDGSSYEQTLALYILDLTDRSAPKLVGKLDLEPVKGDGFLGEVVLTDHALLVGRGTGHYSYDPSTGTRGKARYAYDIFDLADPLAPRLTTRFEVPSTLSGGGWGWGVTGCGVGMPWGFWFPGYGNTSALVSGDLVVSQHEESTTDQGKRVRYYLDRLDVSDPGQPRLLPAINIPGQVVHFDAARQHLVTVDYLHSEFAGASWQDCIAKNPRAWFDDLGKCRMYSQRANALVIEGDKARRVSMLEMESGLRGTGSMAVSDERLFFLSNVSTQNAQGHWNTAKTSLETVALSETGQFVSLPSLALKKEESWGQLYARGARAFMSGSGALTVIDTRSSGLPEAVRHDMQGRGCQSLEVGHDHAYCALGQYGVISIGL